MTIDPRDATHPRTGWFKAADSPSQGGCVEVQFDGLVVRVRDSKDRGEGPIISVDAAAWPGFIAEVTGAAPAGSNRALHIEHLADGGARLRAIDSPVVLTYTAIEWSLFTAGANAGEFTLQLAAQVRRERMFLLLTPEGSLEVPR